MGRTPEKFVRSDQDRFDIKMYVNGKFLMRCLVKEIYEIFRRQGEIRCRVRWLTFKIGECTTGAELRVGLTSTPSLTPGGLRQGSLQGRAY